MTTEVERAENGAPFELREQAWQAIWALARTKKTFHADDVWDYLKVTDREGRWMGGLMQKAARAGAINKAGFIRKPSAKGGQWVITLWGSQVFRRKTPPTPAYESDLA